MIEVDVDYTYGENNGGIVSIGFGGQRRGIRDVAIEYSASGHLTLKTEGDNFYIKWNDGNWSQPKTMTENSALQFGFYHSCGLTFRNLKVYPI